MKKYTTFSNILEVVKFLKKDGWKIKKSSVYLHAKQKKFHPQKDGLYHMKDVEKYARSYLKKNDPASLSAINNNPEAIMKRRSEAEARKIEAQAEHWELKSKIESGNYVPKETFERALAQRAMLFKSDLEAFARGQAPEIIQFVNGDNDKIPDLIEYMLDQFEQFLGRYAEDREFVVPLSQNSTALDHEKVDGEDDKDEGHG
jgi:hypothetical protein